jgi:hypothetical protein
MENRIIHRGCRNFAPVDAVKGICHITKKKVKAEGKKCKYYTQMPKCINCKNYSPDSNNKNIGICEISKNKFMAYGSMTAVTCKSYISR